jgi:predicted small lipoprotein YifL
MIRLGAILTAAAWAVIFLGLIQAAGCGKKTPLDLPEKPGQVLTAPENLKAVVTDSRITLTWTHAPDPENAVLPPQYFAVSMAIPRDCEGCPLVFRTVGRTSMPGMVFEMRVADTSIPRYFRVQAVGDNDIRSDYSATVVVEK